jgi:type II secretory pathway pseudopilin PulG
VDDGDLLMRRLSRHDGFTLPELLTMLFMATIIALAAFSLLDITMKKTGEVQARVTSTQSGRAAMEIIARQLRSQVCLATDPATPPMSAPTGFGLTTSSNTAVFYTDFTDPGTAVPLPELHVLSYDDTKHQLVEKDYTGKVVTTTPPGGSPVNTYTYPTANSVPARTKVLLSSVSPMTWPDGSNAIFRYYTYNTLTPPRPDKELPAAAGLSATDLARVARIDIGFTAFGDKSPPGLRGSVFQDEVYVREADPNDDAPTPTCA